MKQGNTYLPVSSVVRPHYCSRFSKLNIIYKMSQCRNGFSCSLSLLCIFSTISVFLRIDVRHFENIFSLGEVPVKGTA